MARDISEIEYAPEFTSFSNEALAYCLGNGAAKLSGVISQASIDRLNKGVPTHPKLFENEVPEIADFFNLMNIDSRALTYITDIFQIPFGPDGPPPMSHDDSSVAPDGISLLIPYLGEPAFFGAQDERFRGMVTDLPAFMAIYGIGDAMMVRQHVVVDGVEYPSAQHLGIGPSNRWLAAVDVRGLKPEISGIGV